MVKETFILTREEIGDAIVHYISFKTRKYFFPYYITGTDTELHIPDSVMFHLQLLPKGTVIGKLTHSI